MSSSHPSTAHGYKPSPPQLLPCGQPVLMLLAASCSNQHQTEQSSARLRRHLRRTPSTQHVMPGGKEVPRTHTGATPAMPCPRSRPIAVAIARTQHIASRESRWCSTTSLDASRHNRNKAQHNHALNTAFSVRPPASHHADQLASHTNIASFCCSSINPSTSAPQFVCLCVCLQLRLAQYQSHQL